ncbi:MAG: OmpA family protein [Bdellovibrionaceae bacterium]|nr:OmpA family protein [Pseudobdellovibrionaceae bacterium]
MLKFITLFLIGLPAISDACDCAHKTTLKEVTSRESTVITSREGIPLKASFYGTETPTNTASKEEMTTQPAAQAATAAPAVEEEAYTFEFATNSSAPNKQDMQKFNKIADEIAKGNVKQVKIVGFADKTGNMKRNNKLSLDRAKSVRMILEKVSRPVKMSAVSGGVKQTPDLESARIVEVQIVR